MVKERFRPTHRVTLRRVHGGRFVRDWPAWSKYAAKKLRDRVEARWDDGYYAEIEPWPEGDPRTYTESQKNLYRP